MESRQLESVGCVADKRIMVIDDEEDLNRLMKLSLEASGDYLVHYESDPAKALETAREFGPDLMILDLVMPGMDGGELLMKIKGDSLLGGLPIIFLSASISIGSADDSATLFGCPCLTKPAAIDEIVELIEESLDAKSE